MPKLIISTVILAVFTALQLTAQTKATLSGYVKDAKTGETMIGAIISISGKKLSGAQ